MSTPRPTPPNAPLVGPTDDLGRPEVRSAEGAGLAVDGATVRFGTTTALAGVSLRIAPGEVVALLGPSGCGKSTLLRAVAGLQPLDAGCVRWDGADLARTPVHRRGFGLMFQDGQLFAHRDVAGNVAFGLEMAHVPRAERAGRVRELLALVGLAGLGDRAVGTLSGGEQQRVALARALAPRPRLLLLDEPLSALDRALREHLSGELAVILRTAGTTALYVTHDHDEAFAVADRVAVMARGTVLQVDTPARLWRAPASREVAAFLGYAAFVPADDGAHLVAVAPGAARVLGPGEPGAAGDVQVSGVVVGRRERRGAVALDVRLPGGEVLAATVPAGRGRAPSSGETVRVALAGDGVVRVPAPGPADGATPVPVDGYDRRP